MKSTATVLPEPDFPHAQRLYKIRGHRYERVTLREGNFRYWHGIATVTDPTSVLVILDAASTRTYGLPVTLRH